MLKKTGLVVAMLMLVIRAPIAAPAVGAPNNGISVPGSDIPASFAVVQDSYDYVKRDVLIPMRDGVELHTVIVIPKGISKAPIILDRTPYGATRACSRADSLHLAKIVWPSYADLAGAGYILVFQDVRGKFGSGGEYVIYRPLVGPLNATGVDESTDAYDTIDWLIKHVAETNGRVAAMGTSYMGFTALMSLVHPHPALRAAVPIDPVVDLWKGDDWFHNGAFRQFNIEYIYEQTASKSLDVIWTPLRYDSYESWLKAGSAAAVADTVGMDQLPFWRRLVAHPAYDSFWQSQAVDQILARQPLGVPLLTVHGQWDQEDIYGAPAIYTALEPKDVHNDRNFLVIGPWRHGGANMDESGLGPIPFDGNQGRWFRTHVLIPFLDEHLKDNAPKAGIAPVTAFETGTNTWRRYERWPQSCMAGCPFASRSLYLHSGGRLNFSPATDGAAFDEYISDPAKPVTFHPRPIRPIFAEDGIWTHWLVGDQRFAADRPDVLVYTSEVLEDPVRIVGQPVAHFVASTSGSDSDWVVKLIDVYPDEARGQSELGGYQLPIAMDVLRARYRDDPAHPHPVPSGQPVAYRLALPNADHVFLRGHRIMVQVQSSWFPLYDRNPQRYVANIFLAQPTDYQKATQRVYHDRSAQSYIELPVVPEEADSAVPGATSSQCRGDVSPCTP